MQRYAYVGCNPVNQVDPLGYCSVNIVTGQVECSGVQTVGFAGNPTGQAPQLWTPAVTYLGQQPSPPESTPTPSAQPPTSTPSPTAAPTSEFATPVAWVTAQPLPQQPTCAPRIFICSPVTPAEGLQGFGANQFSKTNYELSTEGKAQWFYRFTGGLHGGVDYRLPIGATFSSCVTGTVENVYRGDASPNIVVRVDADGQSYYVVYGHVSPEAATLAAGTQITPGTIPGPVQDQAGNTHLHPGVLQGDTSGTRAYNPLYFMDSATANQVATGPYAESNQDKWSIQSFIYTNSVNYWNTTVMTTMSIQSNRWDPACRNP